MTEGVRMGRGMGAGGVKSGRKERQEKERTVGWRRRARA